MAVGPNEGWLNRVGCGCAGFANKPPAGAAWAGLPNPTLIVGLGLAAPPFPNKPPAPPAAGAGFAPKASVVCVALVAPAAGALALKLPPNMLADDAAPAG